MLRDLTEGTPEELCNYISEAHSLIATDNV